MKIWDFFNSFREEIDCKIYSPEEIYISIIKPNNLLIEELHYSLLNLFTKDILSLQTNDVPDNFSPILVKVFLDYSKKKIRCCWVEIIYYILNTSHNKEMLSRSTFEILDKMKYLEIEDYLEETSTEEKLDIIGALINASFDLQSLKVVIDKELNRKTELIKEKRSLEYELKSLKSRKKELQMTDYYLNAKSRIERYDKKLSELEENEKIYTKTEYLKLKHDLEAKREKYNGALIEMSNLNLSKNQINGRLEDLNFIKRSFKIHQKKFIGIDEEGTEYYFFKDLNMRLYYRKKNNDSQYEMTYYNNEEDIILLLDKVRKEINSKTLLNNLNKIYPSKMKFVNDEKQEDILTRVEHWNKDTCYIQEKKCLVIVIERIITRFDEMMYSKYIDTSKNEFRNQHLNLLNNSQNMSDYIGLLKQLFMILVNPNIFSTDDKVNKRLNDLKYKFIPKEYQHLELELLITDYLKNNIKTKDNLFFISFILEGITENLIKTIENKQIKKPKNPKFLSSIGNIKDKFEIDRDELVSFKLSQEDNTDFNILIFQKVKEN